MCWVVCGESFVRLEVCVKVLCDGWYVVRVLCDRLYVVRVLCDGRYVVIFLMMGGMW